MLEVIKSDFFVSGLVEILSKLSNHREKPCARHDRQTLV